MNRLVEWLTGESEIVEVESRLQNVGAGILALQDRCANVEDENSEYFFTVASLRKQLAETETDRLYWKREATVANLHLAGERRSNASLKGQITKLKGAHRG